jgi:hypothetical protein
MILRYTCLNNLKIILVYNLKRKILLSLNEGIVDTKT